MQRALNMPFEERAERHQALLKRVRARDVTHWREQFLATLNGAVCSEAA
jgi:trehalose 6-phosphate synthase